MREKFGSYDKILRELIVQVRHGKQEAFEELLRIYEPLILSYVGRFDPNETLQDSEDIRQELTVAFYNSILSYDISQTDVSFGLYAKICLNNALITLIRAQKKQKSPETVWLNVEELDQGGEDPSAELIKSEEMRELNCRIEKTLSHFENQVWQSFVMGCSSREIAQRLDTNEKSIDNAIFRIRKKLKPLFLKK